MYRSRCDWRNPLHRAAGGGGSFRGQVDLAQSGLLPGKKLMDLAHHVFFENSGLDGKA